MSLPSPDRGVKAPLVAGQAAQTRRALPPPERVRGGEDDGYVAPRDEFERYLCESWAAVLGLERVGIRDNFFDLGGHSLLAVRVTLLLRRELGIDLEIAMFPQHPTVEELARVLEEKALTKLLARKNKPPNPDRGANLLVRIRPGTSERAPFFCVHGGGSTVLNMRPLAMALPPDLPFYCFQDKGLDGSEPFESIKEAARCYVDEIRQVQQQGPYYLGGTCYGGILAFETARRLEELGETVAALVLIDASNPNFVRSLSERERFFRMVRFCIWRGSWHARRMLTQRPGEWPGYISRIRRALRESTRSPAEVLARQEAEVIEVVGGSENLKRILHANFIARRKFVPEPYGGCALVFRASTRNLSPYDDYYLGWESVVRGGIECFEIEGSHMSILDEPAVRLIAEKLNAKLLESSAGTGEASAPQASARLGSWDRVRNAQG